jgi:hypothetical protein
VPAAQRLGTAPGAPPPALEVAFPLIVKPLTRTPGWTSLAGYPGAIAGVNLPALAYADLTGRERPPVAAQPRRVAWCDHCRTCARRTRPASRPAWLRFVAGCRAICGLAWADPPPFLRGKLWSAVWRRGVSRVRPGRTGRRAPRGPGEAPGSSA